MAANLQTGPEPSLTELTTGIIHDFQRLVKQQLDLFKHEVKADVRKTREASTSLGLGMVVLYLGLILVGMGLAHLLFWLAPDLHLWGSYFIVGGLVCAVGAILGFFGWKQFQSFNPLPDESAEALKENLEWTTKPK